MPTENRSSNTEMVSVPPYIGLEPLVGRYYPAQCRRCGWVGSSEELTEDDAQCTRDAGDRLCLGDCDELYREDLLGIIQAMAKASKHRQVEPVAVLYANGTVLTKADCGDVFDICCKVETPLYTHADPAEVERLRAENEAFDAGMRNLACQLSAGGYNAETLKADQLLEKVQWGLTHLTEAQALLVDTLRAQLAEAHALLRLIAEQPMLNGVHRARIKTLLSASAEPSAPVERDDAPLIDALRTCEKWFVKHSPTAPLIGEFGDAEHPMLTCIRAALERKPQVKS